MSSLFLPTLLMLVLSLALGRAAWELARRCGSRAGALLGMVTIAALVYYVFALRDTLLLVRLMPTPAVVVTGNWLPPLCAVLIGLVLAHGRAPRWRRTFPALVLGLGALFLAYGPLVGRPPPCRAAWVDGVCLQTSDASCSAACAATLLRLHGLPATEQELAGLCLTRHAGTSVLGLYRGLKLKTAGTAWDVAVLEGTPATLPATLASPSVLSVGLGRFARVDPRYERQWGWQRGASHAVVIVRAVDAQHVEMADPSVGKEVWPAEALQVLWHGEGLCLVPRR
jgi:hypothetical protein